MKIEHLREFVACAQEGSFTQAAKKLYTTQPAISKHILSLEEELGVSLLDRNTHTTSLTAIGRVACDLFSRIVNDYDSALDMLELLKSGYEGKVRLGFLLHALTEELYRGASEISNIEPLCKISVEFRDANELIMGLRRGELDACLLLEISYPQDEKIRYKQVKTVPLYALVTEDNPFAQLEEISLEMLCDQTLIMPKNEGGNSELIVRLFEERGLPVPQFDFTPHKGTELYALHQNNGVAIISDISRRLSYSGYAAIPLAEEETTLSFGWFYRTPENLPGDLTIESLLDDATKVLQECHAI